MRDGYIKNKLFYLLASLPLLMGKMLGAETTPPPPPPTPSNYYNGGIKPLGVGPGAPASPIDNYIIYLLIFAVLLVVYFSYRIVQKKKALLLSADCNSKK